MKKKRTTWQRSSWKVLFSIVMVYSISCQTGKSSQISDYKIQLGDLESVIQSGNWLKFYTNNRVEPYTGTLNPGRMTSKGREYHILKFEYYDQARPFNLEDGDTLHIVLDGRSLYLSAYNISKQNNRLSAFYNINKWDIVDIGYASSVTIIVDSKEGELRATLSNENIYNYRYFSAKYILKTDKIPPESKPAYKQPMAFLSGGVGTGVDFWFGYYTNILRLDYGIGDYIALGMGISTFKYDIYNLYAGSGYLWDGTFTENNYNINAMYGLTYPSPFGNWSIEVGFTYQYYFHDENWDTENTGTELYPTYYWVREGKPRNESLIGVFIQAGGLWVQWNRKKLWAVGIAIPIPWW